MPIVEVDTKGLVPGVVAGKEVVGSGFFFSNVRREDILVFISDLVAKMSHFYCLVAKMGPFIVLRPN